MLAAIGAASIDDLFEMVPSEIRLDRPLALPAAMGELELTQHLAALAARNASSDSSVCFLGGGSYDHFIPAAVDAIASRGEFYTSYTPYQPEASQGNLQVFFEYQTLVTELTGMEVSNASLYDGGSAAAEAVLLCMAASRRAGKVVAAASVHPEYRQILSTYLANLPTELVTVPTPGGRVDIERMASEIDDRTGCVLVQHPNFFGCLEEVDRLANLAHERGAMFAVVFDPISLGMLKRPGDYGADVAVAEGQCLGNPMAYGGPYLGIMACREEFVRRMPGRITGRTVDRQGRQCYVLTLQTREQHIRREKATSNICTNQGLFALRATIYLALLGPAGLSDVAHLCLQKAAYARRALTAKGTLAAAFAHPTFKEFVLRAPVGTVDERLARARQIGVFGGLPLGGWYPELSDCLLVSVTEKRTRAEIDQLAGLLCGT